jgi:hypothetical protein
MSGTPTTVQGIQMDCTQAPRSDVTRSRWEAGVNQTLSNLYQEPPNETSRAVIAAFLATKRRLVIIPGPEDVKNAYASGDDSAAAAAPGKSPEKGPPGSGTGLGSDSTLQFTPHDWSPVSEAQNLNVVDEVLLHELVHAVRQALGREDSDHLRAPLKRLARGDGSDATLMAPDSILKEAGLTKEMPDRHSQIYNNLEEFIAVVITNIYRSENRRSGLVRDHLGDNELIWPMTNPRNFLIVWRNQLARMCNEMPSLCNRLASVSCAFNPVFELYAADGRFIPGGRSVKTGADARPFRVQAA